MKCVRYFFIVMFMLLLMTPKPGWVAQEAAGSAKETAASAEKEAGKGEETSGRGEGFETKAEETKEGEECPATFGPIITDTAVPIDKGGFAIQPTFGMGFVVDSLTPNWRRETAGGNFKSFGMEWKFTYGLWDNLESFVVIPYTHNWAGDVNEPGPNGERSADYGGLGDINLTLKYRLVEETEKRPTVTALFATDFPTGKFRHLNPGNLGTDEIGGGAYVFTTGLNLSKYMRPFIVYGNLWYSVQTDYSSDDGRQHPRDCVTLNLAAEYPMTKKWVALLEFVSCWDGGRLFGHKSNTPPGALVSVVPGIEYMATDKFSLALGLNIDMVGKNTDATITPLLSMVYAF
ncbi:transporter [Desulfobacca acetoxidans]|uniref:Transporter n=1 Tax=Desulfobacca acetoxidans (strain ATCC 700848 / DSM 11109 / ASRB2) TaxID=880072 RepID=F2NC95_DESAR|nr:transporter [Desulfobacca acetoxidans]AEB08959.1 hypothetical protein Desac_1095 [Desulfobacca acetoxidans DSM 11109]